MTELGTSYWDYLGVGKGGAFPYDPAYNENAPLSPVAWGYAKQLDRQKDVDTLTELLDQYNPDRTVKHKA